MLGFARMTRMRIAAPFASTMLAAAPAARAADPAWIDAHAHVFTRGLKLAVDARYAPDYDASWQTLLALAEANGAGRAVILQPSFLGYDNSYC
jgi:predicted TIM-barrel fold metal-dependent hydrolase